MQARQRGTNEVRHGAQVFRDDLRTEAGQQPENAFSLRNLRGFVGRQERGTPVALAVVRSIEPDQMVDTESVKELRASASSLLQPFIVASLDHVPAIYRKAPILAGRREVVRRCADRCVDAELVLAGPDVGTVGADDKGKVAENSNAARLAACRFPLLGRDPLQPRAVQDFARKTSPCPVDGSWLTNAEPFVPLEPVLPFVLVMERSKQRIVVQPPLFPLHELAKSGCPRGARHPCRAFEAIERRCKRTRLDGANTLICDTR